MTTQSDESNLWTPEDEKKLLVLWKEHTVLWNKRHKDFRKINAMTVAYNSIADNFPGSSPADIKRKIHSYQDLINKEVYHYKRKWLNFKSRVDNFLLCQFYYDELVNRQIIAKLNDKQFSPELDDILFDLIVEQDAIVKRSTNMAHRFQAWTQIRDSFYAKSGLSFTQDQLKERFKAILKRTNNRMLVFFRKIKSGCVDRYISPSDIEMKVLKYFPSMLSSMTDAMIECQRILHRRLNAQTWEEIIQPYVNTEDVCNNEINSNIDLEDSEIIDIESISDEDTTSQDSAVNMESEQSFPNPEEYAPPSADDTEGFYQVIDTETNLVCQFSEEDLDQVDYDNIMTMMKLWCDPDITYSLLLCKFLSRLPFADFEERIKKNSFWRIIASEFTDIGHQTCIKTMKEVWKKVVENTTAIQENLAYRNRFDCKNSDIFWNALLTFPLLFSKNSEDKFQGSTENICQTLSTVEIRSDMTQSSDCESRATSESIRHPKPIKLPDRAEVIEMNKRLQTASVVPTRASTNALEKSDKKNARKWVPNTKFIQTPSWMRTPALSMSNPEPVKVFYSHENRQTQLKTIDHQQSYSNLVELIGKCSQLVEKNREEMEKKMSVSKKSKAISKKRKPSQNTTEKINEDQASVNQEISSSNEIQINVEPNQILDITHDDINENVSESTVDSIPDNSNCGPIGTEGPKMFILPDAIDCSQYAHQAHLPNVNMHVTDNTSNISKHFVDISQNNPLDLDASTADGVNLDSVCAMVGLEPSQFQDMLQLCKINNTNSDKIAFSTPLGLDGVPQLSIPDDLVSSTQLPSSNDNSTALDNVNTDNEQISPPRLGNFLKKALLKPSKKLETIGKICDQKSSSTLVPDPPQPCDVNVLEESAKNCNIDLRSYYSTIGDLLTTSNITDDCIDQTNDPATIVAIDNYSENPKQSFVKIETEGVKPVLKKINKLSPVKTPLKIVIKSKNSNVKVIGNLLMSPNVTDDSTDQASGPATGGNENKSKDPEQSFKKDVKPKQIRIKSFSPVKNPITVVKNKNSSVKLLTRLPRSSAPPTSTSVKHIKLMAKKPMVLNHIINNLESCKNSSIEAKTQGPRSVSSRINEIVNSLASSGVTLTKTSYASNTTKSECDAFSMATILKEHKNIDLTNDTSSVNSTKRSDATKSGKSPKISVSSKKSFTLTPLIMDLNNSVSSKRSIGDSLSSDNPKKLGTSKKAVNNNLSATDSGSSAALKQTDSDGSSIDVKKEIIAENSNSYTPSVISAENNLEKSNCDTSSVTNAENNLEKSNGDTSSVSVENKLVISEKSNSDTSSASVENKSVSVKANNDCSSKTIAKKFVPSILKTVMKNSANSGSNSKKSADSNKLISDTLSVKKSRKATRKSSLKSNTKKSVGKKNLAKRKIDGSKKSDNGFHTASDSSNDELQIIEDDDSTKKQKIYSVDTSDSSDEDVPLSAMVKRPRIKKD